MPADLVRIAHQTLCLTESAFLKHYRDGRFRAWNGVGLTGSELPGPGFNFAACVGDVPPLSELLPVAEEFFAVADKGWGVLVEGDAGHPVEAELKTRGWAVAEDEPAFVMPDITAGLNPAARLPAGVDIRSVRTEADRRTFQRVCTIAFAAPPEIADLVMPSMGFALDPEMVWLLADVDGEPVGCGGAYRAGPVAVVCCLATLPEFRGRGLGAVVTRATLARAVSGWGSTAAVLRSGPRSVPLYERLGFRYACQHRTYARMTNVECPTNDGGANNECRMPHQ